MLIKGGDFSAKAKQVPTSHDEGSLYLQFVDMSVGCAKLWTEHIIAE